MRVPTRLPILNKEIFIKVLLNLELFSLIETVKNKTILDAGCGEGDISRWLAKSGGHVTAVDYSKKMLEIAERRTSSDLRVEYLHGNLEICIFLKKKHLIYLFPTWSFKI